MNTLALESRYATARQLVPGLLVTALVAMAAAFLGNHYKGSMLLFALLLYPLLIAQIGLLVARIPEYATLLQRWAREVLTSLQDFNQTKDRLARLLVLGTLLGTALAFFAGAAVTIPLLFAQGISDDRFTPTVPQTLMWFSIGAALGYRERLRR